MKTALFTIQNLSAWYCPKKTVLSDFSLELAEHEVVGMVGLNGAGKTTFLKVLSGLLPSFQAEGIWLHNDSIELRGRDFKTSRYTVFAEDNSYGLFLEHIRYEVSGAL